MKKINIEFIEDYRWRFLWALTAISCFGSVIAMSWFGYQNFQKKRDITQQIQNTRSKMPGAPEVVAAKKDSKHTSSLRSALLLQFDLNKIFNTIENIAEPSARLVNMTFDGSTGKLRLEYELVSVENAVVLTEKLNSGYEIRPWQLESLSTTRSSTSNVISSAPSKAMGVWSCLIKSI